MPWTSRARLARPGRSVGDADLERICLENIARFKRPKQYIQVDMLPKNNYGKVLKTELRERLKNPGGPPSERRS